MDGERKKRKKDNDAEAEEDNEEEKMETFFALIRSTKDVKERMVMISNVDRLRLEEEQKNKANANKPVAVWNPKFQPEDFLEDQPEPSAIAPPPDYSTSTAQDAGPSNSKREGDEAKDQDNKRGADQDMELDLNLSL